MKMFQLYSRHTKNLINLLSPRRTICPNESVCRNVSSTVDPAEVDQHAQFTEGWWDEENGPMKPLHSMNRLRVPFIRNGLVNTGKVKAEDEKTLRSLKGLKILDVGCGGGILSVPLARLGAQVVGLDASEKLIECAKNYSKTLNEDLSLDFVSSTIEDFSKTNESKFDAVIMSEIIEHVSAKDPFLNSASQVLKPGGSIFTTTINQTLISWFGAIILAENILRLLPRGVHHYDKFITVENMAEKLEKVGCETITVHGMCYSPISNRWKWSSNTSINYALHSIKKQSN